MIFPSLCFCYNNHYTIALPEILYPLCSVMRRLSPKIMTAYSIYIVNKKYHLIVHIMQFVYYESCNSLRSLLQCCAIDERLERRAV
jgi:hypothetical protein